MLCRPGYIVYMSNYYSPSIKNSSKHVISNTSTVTFDSLYYLSISLFALLCCFVYLFVLWRTKTTPTVSTMWSTQGADLQWITNHYVLFLERGAGVERIGGRSKSILSSAILSLRALIHCCQCPLTDVFVQRSGPSSHAATTPPDTQPTQQQQQNKQGDSTMPKPIASLSAIHSSVHPSIHPQHSDWLCSVRLTLLWSFFATSQIDSCPSLFGRKVRQNSRQKSSDKSNWLWPCFVTGAVKIHYSEHFCRAVVAKLFVWCTPTGLSDELKYPFRQHP